MHDANARVKEENLTSIQFAYIITSSITDKKRINGTSTIFFFVFRNSFRHKLKRHCEILIIH